MKTLECKEIIEGLPPVLSDNDVVALDLELSGLREGQLHRPSGNLLSLAGSFDGERAFIIFEPDQVQEFLNRIEKATWIFHNAVFDLGHLKRWAQIVERKKMRDTLLIERILFNNVYDDFKLNDLVRRYLKCYMAKDIRKEFSEHEGRMTQDQIKYAALDVIGTWLVDKEQQKLLDETDRKVWDNLYNPHVYTTLELGGFSLDKDAWIDLAEGYQEIADKIQLELGNKYGTLNKETKYKLRRPNVKWHYDPSTMQETCLDEAQRKLDAYYASKYEVETFIPLNLASPAQVLKVLQASGLNVEKTDDDALRPHYETNQFVNKLLDFRKAAKQASTYGMEFLKYVEPDGKIYTSLNISLAETGRDCVHGDTILSTSMGDFAISDLPLTALGSCSVLTHTGNQQKILRKIYKGKEEMFEVTLDNGNTIKCTKGHKFLTAEGWKHLYELKENDRLLDPPLPN